MNGVPPRPVTFAVDSSGMALVLVLEMPKIDLS